MISLLLRWLFSTLAVWVAAYLVPGISYENWQALAIAALVLGVLNTVFRPVLTLLSLPLVLVTLGLFLLVINALLLKLTAFLVPGFSVVGFWSAVFGSIIISLLNMLAGSNKSGAFQFASQSSRKGNSSPPHGKGPIIDV